MRRFLILIAILSILMGCQKTSYVAKFDKLPQERVAEQIQGVSTTLASSTNGWVATLPTQAGGGYGFYMSFDGKENVEMLGDMTATSSTTVGKSYYRLKQDMGTELVFDSYNYISMLNDPNSSILGGASKIGYSSDIEFTYDRTSGDSIIFLGKKFRQPLTMIKATAAQRTAYLGGNFKSNIDRLNTYFLTNKFPYIDVPSGSGTIKANILPNFSNNLAAGKRIEFTGVRANSSIATGKEKIAFSTEGITILNGGILFEGIKFVRFAWKDANTLVVFDSTNKEYIIKDNGVPLIDINLLWGAKYTGLRSNYKTINPGTSAAGTTLINSFHNFLMPPTLGFSFNYGHIDLIWSVVNKRLKFDTRVTQSGPSETGGWVTSIEYDYTVNPDGSYKFTTRSAASGGYTANAMVQIDNFLKNNNIKFDYHTDAGIVYCKMTSVNDPNIVITWILR